MTVQALEISLMCAWRTAPAHPQHIPSTPHAQAMQAKLSQVRQLRGLGWGKIAMVEKVWNIKRGGNERWKQAEAEYHQIIDQLEAEEQED
jgi:hypothetical protein